MKSVLVICLLVAAATAAPAALPAPRIVKPQGEVYIVNFDNEFFGSNNYRFVFELSDGTVREEIGEFINEGTKDEKFVVRGYYTYNGPDNVTYKVKYTAGEEGYQPEIEQGPGGSVPEEVIASLRG